MKIVLIGYMGSGKTMVGNELANALQYDFTDLDEAIEQEEGMTISQLFEIKNEIYFRKKEAVVLQKLLETTSKLVLASGGGTPCYGTIMSDLTANTEVITVYLKCGLDTLTTRLFEEKSKRPLLSHLETPALLNDFIRKHLFERAYYYNQADHVIDCDAKTPRAIAEQLIMKLF